VAIPLLGCRVERTRAKEWRPENAGCQKARDLDGLVCWSSGCWRHGIRGPYEPARECAAKLIGAALRRSSKWIGRRSWRSRNAVRYDYAEQVKELVYETAKALGKRSPYDSNE
jgi:hypothetical protein